MKLEGKIINFLGDSITEGHGVADKENNRFDNVMKKTYGLAAVRNYGIGGTRLAYQSDDPDGNGHKLCFCTRAPEMNPDADIVVVYGGENDYLHGDAPIGHYGDTTPDTYCGAVYWLMNYMKETYVAHGKTVLFITPARSVYGDIDDNNVSTLPQKKPGALPAADYAVIIQDTAKRFCLPVLDFYNDLGIDPHRPEDRAAYTTDGLHFNDEGHHILAKKIGDFLGLLPEKV